MFDATIGGSGKPRENANQSAKGLSAPAERLREAIVRNKKHADPILHYFLASPLSRDGFHIGLHYFGNPADFCKKPKIVRCRFFLSPAVSQSFHCDIEPDFVSSFEAIGHRLRGAVNSHGDVFNDVALDPVCEGIA